MKEVNTQNFWTFELRTQDGLNVPIWIVVGFQQRHTQDSQNLKSDTFYRPSVTSAQYNISTENSDSAFLLNYDDKDYSQGISHIKEAFRALTKDNIFKS